MKDLSLQILKTLWGHFARPGDLVQNSRKLKHGFWSILWYQDIFTILLTSHPALHNIFEFIKIFSRVHWDEAVWWYLARQMALLPCDKIYLGPASSTPWFRGISMKYSWNIKRNTVEQILEIHSQMTLLVLPSDKIYLRPASSTPQFQGISMKYSWNIQRNTFERIWEIDW